MERRGGANMSFAKFLSTNRAKFSSLGPLFAEFIDDYFDDPVIQNISGKMNIEQYLWENEATEEVIESLDILYSLYRRTKEQEESDE